MDNLGFLGLAYGVVWLGIAFYLLRIGLRQRDLEQRLEELKKRKASD
jgi:CcmD family protein